MPPEAHAKWCTEEVMHLSFKNLIFLLIKVLKKVLQAILVTISQISKLIALNQFLSRSRKGQIM